MGSIAQRTNLGRIAKDPIDRMADRIMDASANAQEADVALDRCDYDLRRMDDLQGRAYEALTAIAEGESTSPRKDARRALDLFAKAEAIEAEIVEHIREGDCRLEAAMEHQRAALAIADGAHHARVIDLRKARATMCARCHERPVRDRADVCAPCNRELAAQGGVSI